MADMSSDGSIKITIFGHNYYIRGGEDPNHTQELAASVDEKMNFIARQVAVPDNFRVAVLTALHLADEYDVLQKKHKALQQEVSSKAGHLEELLDGLTQSDEVPSVTVLPAAD